ncbi:hypothetical protein [Moraxella sp. E6BC]
MTFNNLAITTNPSQADPYAFIHQHPIYPISLASQNVSLSHFYDIFITLP